MENKGCKTSGYQWRELKLETVTFQMIVEAARNLKGVIKETDFCYSETLSDLTKGDVYLKLENLRIQGHLKFEGHIIKLFIYLMKRKNAESSHQVLVIMHKGLLLVQVS